MFGTGRFPEREESETIPPNDHCLVLELSFFRVKGILSSSTGRPRVTNQDWNPGGSVESVAYNTSSKLALEGR